VVIKEHAHKCNPYFDPIVRSHKRKNVAISGFSVSGNYRRGRNAKVPAAVLKRCSQLLALVALLVLLAA